MSKLTSVELAAEQDRAKARGFFVWWLVASTIVSVGGNAAHALLDYIPIIAVKIAVAMVPPTVALAAIHGVAVLAPCGQVKRADSDITAAGWVYGFSVMVTGLLAGAAAALSFTGLYTVAIAGDLSSHLALMWPLCVDAGIAVSTVALVVLRPASAADLRAARAATAAAHPSAERPARAAAPAPAGSGAPARSGRPAPAPSAPRSRTAHAPALWTVPAGAGDADVSAIARALVDAGATTKNVDQVEQVLTAHARGTAVTRIAADAGIHHKTARVIIDAAAGHQQLATTVG
jgi:hypothetical protein